MIVYIVLSHHVAARVSFIKSQCTNPQCNQKPNKNVNFSMFFFSLISIFIAKVDSRLLRLNCHMSADFKVIKEGEVLQGSVISTFDHFSFQECKAQCLFTENCKSINSQNEDDQICELNDASVPEVSVFCKAVFKRAGWTHASTSYINQRVSLGLIIPPALTTGKPVFFFLFVAFIVWKLRSYLGAAVVELYIACTVVPPQCYRSYAPFGR